MKHNIIFLDIDGVLNNHRFLSHNQNLKPELQRNIDGKKVVLLKEIIAQTGAKIVLSSSWRKMYNDLLEPLSPEAAEIRSALEDKEIEIWDKTDNCRDKADAIINWLNRNRDVTNQYIVIDDDPVLLSRFAESDIVRTSYYIGLSSREVSQAIDKLNHHR